MVHILCDLLDYTYRAHTRRNRLAVSSTRKSIPREKKRYTTTRSYIKHLGIVRVARLVSHSPGMRGWSSATTYCGVPWERRPRYDWILYQEVLERPKGNYLQRSASEFIARDGSYITTGHDGRRRVCRNFPRDCEGTALLRNIEEMTSVSSHVEILVVVLQPTLLRNERPVE